MPEKAEIIWGSGSIPCWKPLIVLEEKKIDYTSTIISFSKKEHKTEVVTKHNKRGQVPTFIDKDGTNVNESNAICFYLEDTYKKQGTTLIPEGERSKVYQRSFEALENMQYKLSLQIVYKLFTPKDKRTESFDEELKTNKEAFIAELKLWEEHLEKTKYAASDNFTMADVFLFPFLAWAVRMSLNLGKFPKIKAYYDELKERESIKKTVPPHWKEPPSDSSKELLEALKDL